MNLKYEFSSIWQSYNATHNLDSLDAGFRHAINRSLEEVNIDLFDYNAYLSHYPDVRNVYISKKMKIGQGATGFDPLRVLNHYFQFGRSEGRTAYCIRENGEKVLYRGFNFENYNRVCETAYYSRVNNELNGMIHYLNQNPKPKLLNVKSNVNIFEEPSKNKGWVNTLQHEWNEFNAWDYKKTNGKRGGAKELFIDYITEIFTLRANEEDAKITYENFDWERYLDDYTDLPDAGLNTKDQAWNHWYYTGIHENRLAYMVAKLTYENFDWKRYLADYADLPNAGLNTKYKAWNHWKKFGENEGRLTYALKFQTDWQQYFANVSKTQLFNKITLENHIIDTNDNNYTYLHDNHLVLSNNYNIKHTFKLLTNDNLDILNNFILVIDFPNGGGGTTIFLNKIISKYKHHNTFIIARNYNGLLCLTINDDYELIDRYNIQDSLSFIDKYQHKFQKIFVNHTLDHNPEFLNKVLELTHEKIFITHDYYSICTAPQPLFDAITINNNKYLNKFTTIITQNYSNLYIFNNQITNKNIEICINDLPDYKEVDKLITSNNNDKIIVGIIGVISDIKGRSILHDISEYYKNNKNIEIVVFGNFEKTKKSKNIKSVLYKNISELNKLLIEYKPNVLLELSMWHETYSFTLSLAMITNLPILYVKKNGRFTVEKRLSNCEKYFPFENLNQLNDLIITHKQNYFYTIKQTIFYNSFWDKLFERDNQKRITYTGYKNNLNIYPIYFPQFHTITENNYTFYPDYNDAVNLSLVPKEYNSETPNLSTYNLKNISDYNLLNTDIIQKQVDIMCEYNYCGFSIYYYWFSQNTITNNNLIMEKVIDTFFNGAVQLHGKKIFLIWANESWSNNPAFGKNNHHIIANTYEDENLDLNVNVLITYFKNENYLKKDNKPVFMLHHPWFLTTDQLKLFEMKLNSKCLENNFDGVHFIVNSMDTFYKNFHNYNINFNYKKQNQTFYCAEKQQIYLDYDKYYNQSTNKDNVVDTLIFNFDNRARLTKPDRLKCSTICINNCEFNKIRFMKSRLINYETQNKFNIVLINAWNEWGEQMSIEPSNEYQYYYLNLINEYIGC